LLQHLCPPGSVHTSNFSAILKERGVSVLVTTYQAGKLVMLLPDGERLNTHFRGFSKPMGLAVDGDRLANGTSVEIWEYHNAPAVARRLEPADSQACFLPRSSVCTGDIQIHEMASASRERQRPEEQPEPELWFVNFGGGGAFGLGTAPPGASGCTRCRRGPDGRRSIAP
jgi:hypothetical protein